MDYSNIKYIYIYIYIYIYTSRYTYIIYFLPNYVNITYLKVYNYKVILLPYKVIYLHYKVLYEIVY